jgi:hypothetical protein
LEVSIGGVYSILAKPLSAFFALKCWHERRAFLMAAGTAALSPCKIRAQPSLGTLAWLEDVAGGSLWIRELPDGAPLQIATAAGLHSPRFSPAGRWISFRNADDKRWAVSLAVPERVGRLFDADDIGVSPNEAALLIPEGVFAPDGQHYVFSRVVPGKSGDDSRIGQLCLAALDCEPKVLVKNEQGEMQPYAWTRDGKSVIYWSGDEFSASLWSDGVPLKSANVESGMVRDLRVSVLAHEDMLDLAPPPPETSSRLLKATAANLGRQTGRRHRSRHRRCPSLLPKRGRLHVSVMSPDGVRIACFAGPDADIAYNKANAGRTYTVVRPNGSKVIETITLDSNIDIGGGEEAHL